MILSLLFACSPATFTLDGKDHPGGGGGQTTGGDDSGDTDTTTVIDDTGDGGGGDTTTTTPPDPEPITYGGAMEVVFDDGRGNETTCAGSFEMTVDTDGVVTGTASCEAQVDWGDAWTMDGTLSGDVANDHLVGLWTYEVYGYTYEADLSGVVSDAQADIDVELDDWFSVSGHWTGTPE